jgi:lysozyme
VVCLGTTAWLFYAGILFFNNPSSEKYPVKGVDVSNYQGDIDWDAIAKQNIHFAFIKATEGSSFVDPYFQENYENAAKTGIRVGAYHFFSFDSDGDTQAENFIMEVKKLDNMLPPVIDVEFYDDKRSNPPSKETVKEHLNIFIEKIQEAYGVNPIIYAVYETYDLYIKDDFNDCDIWIRDVFRTPKLSDNRDWTFWQYTDRARINGYNGVEKCIDLNVFNGTSLEFVNYGIASEPVWKLVEQGRQYEIYYAENTFEYSYIIYDAQENEVYNSRKDDIWLKGLKIKYISDDIMKVQ